MKGVIYARYSSDHQREESIEGQIRECTAFAEKNGIKLVIQAKLYYKHNVGNKGVQEVYTAKNMFCGQVAVVVTNSYFSKSAIETAAKCDVVLIDRDMLGKLIKNNSRQNEELFDQIIYEKLKRNI